MDSADVGMNETAEALAQQLKSRAAEEYNKKMEAIYAYA